MHHLYSQHAEVYGQSINALEDYAAMCNWITANNLISIHDPLPGDEACSKIVAHWVAWKVCQRQQALLDITKKQLRLAHQQVQLRIL